MRMSADGVLHAVQQSKGNVEGVSFDSTKFHIEVDLKENSVGKAIGCVTRPFKFGDSTEFDKYAHLGSPGSLPAKVKCLFEVTAGAQNQSKVELVGLQLVDRATK